MSLNLQAMTVAELLRLHAQIGDALRERDVLRSANNPTGDLAERIFCDAFGWQQASNSERGHDAIGVDKTRYQIKGRRIHRRNKSRQLSVIRDLERGHFDILAGVLFDDFYNVLRAVLIPRSVVEHKSKYRDYLRGHVLTLSDEIWALDNVKDVTDQIRATSLELLESTISDL